MPTLFKKNTYGVVYARLFNCAAASFPWRLLRTYLESCANIVQAVAYCPPYRPPSSSNPLCGVVRSRNPFKSTLAHDAVATAALHKHHPIIRVGAGLMQFVYRSHLRLATEATRNRNAFSPFFARVSIHLKKPLNCLSYQTFFSERDNVVYWKTNRKIISVLYGVCLSVCAGVCLYVLVCVRACACVCESVCVHVYVCLRAKM